MKQKDIAVILLVIAISGFFAFLITSRFVSTDKNQTAEVVAPITSAFDVPDKKIFNVDAYNPTVLIRIAPNENDKPFANE